VVKNRLKTIGVKKNALAYQKIVADHGSLDTFLWNYVGENSIVNIWKSYRDTPTHTEISTRLSKDLKKYGFTFV
jgi:DNA-3-methyladenine glycosylase I